MASPSNSVPDTQLGLTNDEIALLRHHQQAAASTAGGSSSRAASRASSQGLLLLDGSSLAALGRHFDRLMQQIQARLDYLSEQSQMVAQQQYDRAGNAIAIADSEIARFHDILRQIDELEVDFDKIRHIRDIVRSYRQRVDEMEQQMEHSGSSSRHRHRHHGESSGSSSRRHRRWYIGRWSEVIAEGIYEHGHAAKKAGRMMDNGLPMTTLDVNEQENRPHGWKKERPRGSLDLALLIVLQVFFV
jgi:hypothetical protein